MTLEVTQSYRRILNTLAVNPVMVMGAYLLRGKPFFTNTVKPA